MTIQGYATVEETTVYADQHPEFQYLPLNSAGVRVSQAGFGCYRVDVSVDEHRQALRQALLAGINLIDTSANYMDGGSEKLVGEVLAEMTQAGTISRGSVVVVSKVGYLQGQNYELSQQRKRAGNPFPDLVPYGEGLEHCIHPEFLEDQLTRSLQRLQLETLDCYLLHNPEYYLGWANMQGVPLEQAREEYYRRIELAFRHLEREVEQGRISSYGISSNTFPSATSDEQFTSLERAWSIAEAISPNHHFQVIQLPMNLYETGGLTQANQSNGQTVIEFARSKGLGVLINRPLNAFHNRKLIRLADVAPVSLQEIEQIPALLQELVTMEGYLKESLMPTLVLSAEELDKAQNWVMTGGWLARQWHRFSTRTHWQDAQVQVVVPTAQRWIGKLVGRREQSEGVVVWLDLYVERLNLAMQAITLHYQHQDAEVTREIKQRVSKADAEWGGAHTLSQMAIRALRSTAGITTVLVGMRQDDYVQDVIDELKQPIESRDCKSSWQRIQV